ncbi:hypothetical protein [Stenotrophomonas sp. CFBP8980]|uniref:hypothetical protein n=1 Tax=Stenotrophomonas sp. CFBP8980 TaxID=3096523 RepID=UPI002A69F72C|nr:hypothetical protein [Stenotrophomonas sp. CFBP8980]MDY1033996.1 hypothetical protein [Stenotrophomonas sp. CFBP8980]
MISRVRRVPREAARLPKKQRHYPIEWRSVLGRAWSRSGRWEAAAFALLYLACLLLDLLDSVDFIYLVVMVTLPFSLVAFAAADALQAPLGLSFETLNWVTWVFLGVFGLVEFYVIGHGLGSAWRQ